MMRIAAVLLLSTISLAQAAPAPPAQATPVAGEVRAADVDTIDHIVAALYDVISGPPGPRDWSRFRALFLPEAHLVRTGIRDGAPVHVAMTPDEYAQRSGATLEKMAFFESETARRMERFGNIAHVFSTYASRREKNGAPFARGINSIQLLQDGKRWYIVSVIWDSERPDNPIPPEYQGSSQP